MAARFLRVSTAPEANDAELRRGVAEIQREQGLDPRFSDEVEKAAAAAAAAPRLPDADRTDLPFVTVDPSGSRDLDQAMHLERAGDGFVVHYAIADVAAFVTPGDPVDLEARRRGESMYGADTKIPLHPTVLSEGAASLLPGEVRPAFVWTLELDAHGECTRAGVERARVRSTAQLDYESLQRADTGDLYALLRAIGELRIQREIDRGGIDLPMPEQEVVIDRGRWSLEYRTMLPVERWNAQISLLTGFAAGKLMVEHGIGLLRTLPPPPDGAVRRLRRTAKALDIAWADGESYPEVIRRLDAGKPHEAALIVAATSLLRGAGYVGFDGSAEHPVPEHPEHSALASVYAHCTAPLRRLVDRYALETAAALCAGTDVPGWVRDQFDAVPQTMQDSGRRAHAYENAVVNLVEAELLADRVGQRFDAVVLELDERKAHHNGGNGSAAGNGDEPAVRADIQIREPAIEAVATAPDAAALPVGERVAVRLGAADPATRKVVFEAIPPTG